MSLDNPVTLSSVSESEKVTDLDVTNLCDLFPRSPGALWKEPLPRLRVKGHLTAGENPRTIHCPSRVRYLSSADEIFLWYPAVDQTPGSQGRPPEVVTQPWALTCPEVKHSRADCGPGQVSYRVQDPASGCNTEVLSTPVETISPQPWVDQQPWPNQQCRIQTGSHQVSEDGFWMNYLNPEEPAISSCSQAILSYSATPYRPAVPSRTAARTSQLASIKPG